MTTGKKKKLLDRLFSIAIRRVYADINGNVSCYTCGAKKHWKQIQNGHYISRNYLATRFDVRNCKPQCAGCNIWGRGRLVEFGTKLELENPGITTQLRIDAQKIIRYYPYDEELAQTKEFLSSHGWI